MLKKDQGDSVKLQEEAVGSASVILEIRESRERRNVTPGRRQALARHVVDDVEDAKTPAAGQPIVEEIE